MAELFQFSRWTQWYLYPKIFLKPVMKCYTCLWCFKNDWYLITESYSRGKCFRYFCGQTWGIFPFFSHAVEVELLMTQDVLRKEIETIYLGVVEMINNVNYIFSHIPGFRRDYSRAQELTLMWPVTNMTEIMVPLGSYLPTLHRPI